MPAIDRLRPTPDRVRETLFNWLQPVIEGAACLDLYAGTGALGLEAVSRGASRAVLVESNMKLAGQIAENIKTLAATEVFLERSEAINWLKHNTGLFDIIFLDPPFEEGLIEKSCELIRETGCLKPGGLIYIEAEKSLELPSSLTIKKQGVAGHVQYVLAQVGDW